MNLRDATHKKHQRLLHLVVQHHHIVRVAIEPCIDGLAHAADLVQRRRVVVRPAEVEDLERKMQTR